MVIARNISGQESAALGPTGDWHNNLLVFHGLQSATVQLPGSKDLRPLEHSDTLPWHNEKAPNETKLNWNVYASQLPQLYV